MGERWRDGGRDPDNPDDDDPNRDDSDEGHSWSDDDSFDRLWSDDADGSDSSDDYGASDDEAVERECPKCGCGIYAESERCPLCGEWLSHSATVWDGRPAWFIWLGLAGIVAVILSILMVAV